MSKGKFFKNPGRGQAKPPKAYVPQYAVHGVEPEMVLNGVVSETVQAGQLTRHAPTISYNNPRIRPVPTPRVQKNIPFAEVPSGPSQMDGPLPNTGNNMENTWASFDGEVFDDLSEDSLPLAPEELDQNHLMIDNNDSDTRNWTNIPQRLGHPSAPQYFAESVDEPETDFLDQDYEYLLLLHNNVISAGSFEEIQEELSNLLLGKHEFCKENNGPFSLEDVVVLKKMQIKVGVFVE